MIRDHILVYDDYIPDGAPVYTGVQHVVSLGQADQLGFHAVVDNALSPGQLTVAIEHSTDGINWSQKNTPPEIDTIGLLTSGTTSIYGGEPAPTRQSLEFVRLRISILNGRGASVRLYATLRDRGKGAFAGCGCDGGGEGGHDHEGHDHINEAEHRERLQALVDSRPHEALESLAQHLAAGPAEGALQDRLKVALAALPEHERGEATRYLTQVAAAEAFERDRPRSGE